MGRLFSVLPRLIILQKAQELWKSIIWKSWHPRGCQDFQIMETYLETYLSAELYSSCRVGLGFLRVKISHLSSPQPLYKDSFRSQQWLRPPIGRRNLKTQEALQIIEENIWGHGQVSLRLHELNKHLSFWLRSDFHSTVIVLSTSSWDSFIWYKSCQQSRS